MLEIWEDITGRTRKKCAFLFCGNNAIIGCHVQIRRRINDYIVAICLDCYYSKPEYKELKRNTACVEIIRIRKRDLSSSSSSSSESSSSSSSDSDSKSEKKNYKKEKRKKNKQKKKKKV